MTTVYGVVVATLSVAGGLTLWRLLRGPGVLDRILALDVVVTLIVAGVAVAIPVRDEPADVVLLAAIALLGFVGTITAAHLVEEREDLW